jgi:hypothetical protein
VSSLVGAQEVFEHFSKLIIADDAVGEVVLYLRRQSFIRKSSRH